MRSYVNYAHRLVIPRPRRVVFAPGFWNCEIASRHHEQIASVAQEIEEGKDLRLRLSRQIRFRGYRPDKYDDNGRFIGTKWWNKDFALNALGLHHLHLTKTADTGGRVNSDVLLFVEFVRDQATLVMAGNHIDLDGPSLEQRVLDLRATKDAFVLKGIMAPSDGGYSSTQRIDLAKAGVATLASVDGKVVVGANIANDGSSEYCAFHSARLLRALSRFDPLFDDRDWIEEQFSHNDHKPPHEPQFEWWLQGTNLLMYEKMTGAGFPIVEGRQGWAEVAA